MGRMASSLSVLCQKKDTSIVHRVTTSADQEATGATTPSSQMSPTRAAALAKQTLACQPFPSLIRLQENLVLDSSSKTKAKEYLRYGLRIAQWAGADPAVISEDQVRAFFIAIKREGLYAPNTVRLMTAALRFLFVKVLGRAKWAVFSVVCCCRHRCIRCRLFYGHLHAALHPA